MSSAPAWEDPPQEGDDSSLGGEETKDLLLKLNWTPTNSTELNFKYAYTEGEDDHFPAMIPADLSSQTNCYIPEDPDNPVVEVKPGLRERVRQLLERKRERHERTT